MEGIRGRVFASRLLPSVYTQSAQIVPLIRCIRDRSIFSLVDAGHLGCDRPTARTGLDLVDTFIFHTYRMVLLYPAEGIALRIFLDIDFLPNRW
mgnify:CR=1 FL=1